MIKAIDLEEVVDYVCKGDAIEPKTVWKLGVLDTRIRKSLEDVSWDYSVDPSQPGTGQAKASFNIGKTEIEFVKFGLRGFENFLKKDGKQVYFKTEDVNMCGKVYHLVTDEIIKIIPGDVIHELAEKIREINAVSEEERKN